MDQPVARNSQSQVPQYSSEVETLTIELLGHIADKWTMLVLEELGEHGTLRFNELRKLVPKISQKMLTQTLRQMERIGLVERRIFAEVPPRVEYQTTNLGKSLGPAVCGLWDWVEQNSSEMRAAIQNFDQPAKEK